MYIYIFTLFAPFHKDTTIYYALYICTAHFGQLINNNTKLLFSDVLNDYDATFEMFKKEIIYENIQIFVLNITKLHTQQKQYYINS